MSSHAIGNRRARIGQGQSRLNIKQRPRRADVETLEPRQLLSAAPLLTPTESSPFVSTFGKMGIDLVSFRSTQDALATLAVAPGRFVVVGDTAAAGAHKAGFIYEQDATGAFIKGFAPTFVSFGSAGDTLFNSVAVQSNGDLVVGGIGSTGSNSDFGVVYRFTPMGKVDTTFNGSGYQKITFGSSGLAGVSSLVVQPATQKIDAIGGYFSTSTLSGGLGVAQFLPNGHYDSMYAAGGIFKTTFNSFNAELGTRAILNPSGGLYVAGTQITGGLNFGVFPPAPRITGAKFELLSLTPGGALNTKFGVGGRSIAPFGYKYEFATSLALDPKSKNIVVGGTSANGVLSFGTPFPVGASSSLAPAATWADFAVARFLATNGKLDTTFNKTGTEWVPFGTGRLNGASALAVLPDSTIVVGGGSDLNHRGSDLALASLKSTGGLNTAFATGGELIYHVPNQSVGIFDFALFSGPDNEAGDPLEEYLFTVGHQKSGATLGDIFEAIIEPDFPL